MADNIPTYSGGVEAPTQAGAPLLNPNAFQATPRAMVGLGQDISQTGANVQDAMQKMLDKKIDVDRLAYINKFSKDMADYERDSVQVGGHSAANLKDVNLSSPILGLNGSKEQDGVSFSEHSAKKIPDIMNNLIDGAPAWLQPQLRKDLAPAARSAYVNSTHHEAVETAKYTQVQLHEFEQLQYEEVKKDPTKLADAQTKGTEFITKLFPGDKEGKLKEYFTNLQKVTEAARSENLITIATVKISKKYEALYPDDKVAAYTHAAADMSAGKGREEMSGPEHNLDNTKQDAVIRNLQMAANDAKIINNEAVDKAGGEWLQNVLFPKKGARINFEKEKNNLLTADNGMTTKQKMADIHAAEGEFRQRYVFGREVTRDHEENDKKKFEETLYSFREKLDNGEKIDNRQDINRLYPNESHAHLNTLYAEAKDWGKMGGDQKRAEKELQAVAEAASPTDRVKSMKRTDELIKAFRENIKKEEYGGDIEKAYNATLEGQKSHMWSDFVDKWSGKSPYQMPWGTETVGGKSEKKADSASPANPAPRKQGYSPEREGDYKTVRATELLKKQNKPLPDESKGEHWPDMIDGESMKAKTHITYSDEKKGGGHWKEEGNGHWSFTPGPTNLKHHTITDYMKAWDSDYPIERDKDGKAIGRSDLIINLDGKKWRYNPGKADFTEIKGK